MWIWRIIVLFIFSGYIKISTWCSQFEFHLSNVHLPAKNTKKKRTTMGNICDHRKTWQVCDQPLPGLFLALKCPFLQRPSGFSSGLIWFCLQWRNFRNTSWIHAHIRSHTPVFSITLLLNGSEELSVCVCVCVICSHRKVFSIRRL